MKKLTKVLALTVVAAMLCLVLASCGGLSGKYKADALVAGATYEFKGNKVTVTAEVFGFEKSFEGKYKLVKDGDVQKIEFTFEDSDAEKYSGTFSFEKGEDYIKIGGVKYNAVKG
jgi:uncharacterized lipoprotein YehR (DUF1307 family)